MSSLHIGVFRGGSLVDERYAPLRGSVTIGQSSKNTLWLSGEFVPEQHSLVTFEHRRPTLHLVKGMKGEIAFNGKATKQLAEFDDQSIELPRGVRGRLVLGDTTFFLQDIERPKPPPKSALPRNVRTGFLSGLDRTFARVLVGVFIAELAFFLFVHSRPHIAADPPLVQEEPDRFVEVAIRPKQAPKPLDSPKAAPKLSGAPQPTHPLVTTHDPVEVAIENNALIAAIGAVAKGGAAANVFNAGPGLHDDLAAALADMDGVKIADGPDGPGHKGAAGPGGVVTIGGLDRAVSGGERVRLHAGNIVTPNISIETEEVEVEEGGAVDKVKLGRLVHERLQAIQSCYERELKLLPGLKGKISIHFTITPDGATGECSVEEDNLHDDNVSACVMSRIRTWRYPFRPSHESPVTFPFVFQGGT